MSDPHIDPESEILRNELALANQERLHRAEANAVSARSILLQLYPPSGSRSRCVPNVPHIQGRKTHASQFGGYDCLCGQHFSREAVFPWTDPACGALETAI